jgi:uncharacterized protein (TIGR02453 family)
MPKAVARTLGRFEGFADGEARFFRGLARNQRRDWFQAHRAEYEEGWQRPMQALLAEVRERIDPFFPAHPLAEPKVFRIYRDVRFSRDKSPYKTHIGGYIALGGAGAGPSVPAPLYLHVAPTESFVAAGHYMMHPEQLARYREAVLDDRCGEGLVALLAKLARAGFVAGSHEVMTKVPRGADPGHPRAALLKRKGLIVTFPPLPRALLVERRLVDWLVSRTRHVVPLVEWLAALTE